MAHHRKPPTSLMLVLVGGPALFRSDDPDWHGGYVIEWDWPPTEEPPDVIVWQMWAPWRRGFVEYAYSRGEHLPDDGEIIYRYRLPLLEAGYDPRIALGEEGVHSAA